MFDNTKYHVQIASTPLIVRGYTRGESNTFVPRMSQGQSTVSDFSLLSSKEVNSFAGGMLQRYWENDNAVFATESLYPIYDDGVLYPVNESVATSGLIGKAKITARFSVNGYGFIAYQTFTSPVNVVKRINPDGSITTLSLTVSLTNASKKITSMVWWNDRVWFGCSSGSKIYNHDLTTTSITEPGGTGCLTQLAVLNGTMYGADLNNNAIYKYTGDNVTLGFLIVYDPKRPYSDACDLLNFNGRLILARSDGLFSYDGVTGSTIEMQDTNIKNYRFAVVLRGYLYYFMESGWHRYSGSIIEKIYDASEIGYPVSVTVAKDRIWLGYSNSDNGSSRYDKSLGYDYSTGNNIDGRVLVFNGRALYTYTRTSTFVKNPGTQDFDGQDELSDIFWHNNRLYIFPNYAFNGDYHYCDTNELLNSGDKPWKIVTSIFGKDFAMINKNIENVELVFDGTNTVDKDITVEFRTSGFDGSGSWVTLGTIKTVTKSKIDVARLLPSGITAKLVQFRFVGDTDVALGIAKVIIRYNLNPEFKWQWQFSIQAVGDNPLQPLVLADGITKSTQTIAELRDAIYSARTSQTPIIFVDFDKLDLNGAINNSVTTIVLNNTKLLKGSSGYIQIDDEIMYWTAKTSTDLTVERGKLGTSAASHVNNSKVFIVYRVIVDRIVTERVEFLNRHDQGEDKNRATDLAIVLREV